jgi:hypothetical protein
MTLRPILPVEAVAVEKPAGPDAAGTPPQLDWIRIDRLVVDESYQRALSLAGIRNIRTIAENFRWSSFSPVIVSPVVGGRFAIVDGQHRTTAAALCGFESVPCQVVTATATEQASAFRRINGNTTRIHPMHLFAAAVAAGEPKASQAARVAREAGVTILRNPKRLSEQQPGETMCFGAILVGIRDHGEAATRLALEAICQPGNAGRGVLVAPIITAMIAVVAERHPSHSREAILAAVDRVRLVRELDHATREWRERGGTLATALKRRLLDKVDRVLSPVAA